MRIFAITKPGLVAMTISVATLWTCLALETATRRQSDREMVASIQKLARLRQLTRPAQIETPARESQTVFRAPQPFKS
jgi:hypothetical protein